MNYASARRPGPRRRRSRVRSFVTALQILILVGISASVGAGLAMFVSLSTVLPKIDEIEDQLTLPQPKKKDKIIRVVEISKKSRSKGKKNNLF